MNQKKIIIRLIPFALFLVTAWLLCLTQAYVSMREYSNSLSANCMTCSLLDETFRFSLFVPIVFALIYAALWKVKNSYRAIILTIIYALACMFVNHEIFVSRESAWSTYTMGEELSHTWHLSYLAILLSSALLFLATIGTNFIVKNMNNLFLKLILPLCLFCAFGMPATAQTKPSSIDRFCGTWSSEFICNEDEMLNSRFELYLEKDSTKKNAIIGWHCSEVRGGRKIDCFDRHSEEPSLNGYLKNDTVYLHFVSSWEVEGEAKLYFEKSAQNQVTLIWVLGKFENTSQGYENKGVDTEHYMPFNDTLRRKEETIIGIKNNKNMNLTKFIPAKFENINFESMETEMCPCSPNFPHELNEVNTVKINVPEKIFFHSLDEEAIPVLPVCIAYSKSYLRGVKYCYFSQQKIHIKHENENIVYSADYYDKSTVNKIPNISIEEEEGRQKETKEAQKLSDKELDESPYSRGYFNINALDYVQLPIKSGKYEVWVSYYGLESNHAKVEITLQK